MSTRSIIIFKDKTDKTHTYVHFDGYPSNRLVELQEFLKWNGPRNDDLAYATANFILWYKLQSIKSMNEIASKPDEKNHTLDDMLRIRETDEDIHRGIGVIDESWDDQAYRYEVDFDAKTIHVTGYECDVTVAFGQTVEFDENDNPIIPEETPIPA